MRDDMTQNIIYVGSYDDVMAKYILFLIFSAICFNSQTIETFN